MAKIDSPADDLMFTVSKKGDGGRPGYPTQTASSSLPKIVEQHLSQGDAPSNPRAGSRGKVNTPASDALIKTR